MCQIVGGAVETGGEHYHLRGVIIGTGEEQQFNPTGQAGPDGKVDAVVLGCGPQLTAMTGGYAHDKAT
ncbi:hypothetical protein IYQ_03388 [Aeromonas salmonicida subsp. salmonicida 01-B526]|uniref:Uncharacterized protein n=1 Tax=Aeromonas salmonicida subsp. salmonicida 01-B526 TaxID=1076135 RepID=A0ABP2N4F0_AERSS|nr:hypothetical protein IYQ_03388 [Aeromonas salmonicida subsp. salmonicida 01-B526]